MIAVAAALALAQPPPWVQAERLRVPAEAYREIVERYRRGDRAGAVAEPFAPEVALQQVAALREVAGAALRIDSPAHERVRARDLVEAFPLEAAVLLHTERALDRLQRDDPAAAAELEIGLQLVVLMGEARRRAFEPRWLRAAALGLSRLGEFDLALKLMEPAVSRYQSDPLLFLARGAALEAKARLHPQTVAARRDLFGRRRAASAERDHLLRAEQGYRDALALKPDLHQARVRLGRVRALLGRLDASVADLQAVVASGAGVRDRYLAHLFLGHTREAAGRFADAAAEYAQALRVEPDGQAAAVALSHTLHLQGRAAESVEALRSGVARAGRRAVADPWWPYVAGQWEDAEAVMDALRAEASQ